MPSKAVVDCWLPTWLSIITISTRAEGGGVAADCHAAFDVVDLVADDGRVGRVVFDHYPEAVGVINQARAVDDAVQHQQILAAAARLPEALRQYGTATDVF